MKNIVSSIWLKENIDNENIVIVDCRFNLMDREYSQKSYEAGHIKNAVRIDLETQLSGKVREHGGRHPLPSVEELKNTFEDIGINNDSVIVCYSDDDLAGAARLWWILKYLGHDKVYVLEGGISSFESLGGPITTDVNMIKKGEFKVTINEEMNVDMNYVKERVNNSNVAIVDSREYKRYIGEFEPVDKKAGHIPNSMNYFWMDIFTENEEKVKLKSLEELDIHFKDLKEFEEVIIYCGSGITACPNSLALNEINIAHKVYTGSFSDWISYKENDIQTK